MGGEVIRAPELMHGKTSRINHTGKGLFRGLNSGFEATRYHSLIVEPRDAARRRSRSPPSTDDGLIMGVQHQTLPLHGVQFHPESIASRERPRAAAEFPQHRPRLQPEEGRMMDIKAALDKIAAAPGSDRRGNARRDDHHHVGRGDAEPDRRLPDGHARQGRDASARSPPRSRSCARRWCRSRRRRTPSTSSAPAATAPERSTSRPPPPSSSRRPACRSPSTATGRCRRKSGAVRRAAGAGRQDRPRRPSRSRAASARPASASCSRRRIIRR